MEKLAVQYYQDGYGCSACIIKAAEHKYGIKLDSKAYKMLASINTGFGVGEMCSVVIACVMVLGLIYGEQDYKKPRLVFLNEFQQQFGSTNCTYLLRYRKEDTMCQNLVESAAKLLDKVISTRDNT